MNLTAHIAEMERSAQAIAALVRGVDADTAARRPAPGKWCLREILAHLHDEEREDFRVRVEYTLHRPGEPWPPIDPEGWVTERNYLERPLESSLDGFLYERGESLAWLRTLDVEDWTPAFRHPRGFVIQAGEVMASWVAHDLLHLRQITWTLFRLLGEDAAPFGTRYAGEWPDQA